MRIFVAVRHSNDPALFYGGLWSSNFYPALRELGCEIVESQVDLLPTSRFMDIANDFTPQELAVRGRITERILDEVREAHQQKTIDLFLSYFYNSHFDPAGFAEIRKLGIPSVNFYCNSIYQFALVAAIAARVDLSWHPERDARSSYVAAGARPIWIQMGADPKLCRPINGLVRQRKVCFVGQRYADRERWLAALADAAVPVDIYGRGWIGAELSASSDDRQERAYLGRRNLRPGSLRSYVQVARLEIEQNGMLGGFKRLSAQAAYWLERRRLINKVRPHAKGPAADVAKVFSSYEVCVNFSNVWADGRPGSQLIPHVRLRDFEGPMSRTCYLTGHSEEISEFYAVGQEIDTYGDESELVDKARFYLANPDRAERLRNAGYQRAARDHTWRRRFEELFRKIDQDRV
jgi:spore maturation protein CgeB